MNSKFPFVASYRHIKVEQAKKHHLGKIFDPKLKPYFPKGWPSYQGLGKAPLIGTQLRLNLEEAKEFLEWQYTYMTENKVSSEDVDFSQLLIVKEELGKNYNEFVIVEVVAVDTMEVLSNRNRKHTIVHPEGEIIVKPVNKKANWEAYSFPPNMLNLKNVHVVIREPLAVSKVKDMSADELKEHKEKSLQLQKEYQAKITKAFQEKISAKNKKTWEEYLKNKKLSE